MKKNVLALSIAAAVFGMAGAAHAVTALDASGTATDLRISRSGTGHMLVVPYFTTQNGNSTLISITNTTNVGKAVKVRFRGAANSDDIYDFQVFLSPQDVWTANISANANGLSQLTTADASCTKPAKTVLNSTPFVTSRLDPALSAENKAKNTREGYIEIFNMADIPNSTTGLYPIIKHVNGVAPCANIVANPALGVAGNNSWTTIDTDTTVATLKDAPIGMTNPTSGLLANWTVINVPKAVSWSGDATAVEATSTAAGVTSLATGNLVYFPQVKGTITGGAAVYTADPLLAGGVLADGVTAAPATALVDAGLYDLPDMSTPYTVTAGAAVSPAVQAANLTASIAATQVINEYVTDPFITAETDWVFSMPTRRYSAAVSYKTAGATAGSVVPAAVYNNDPGLFNQYFGAANTKMVGNVLCVNSITQAVYNREEARPGSSSEVVVSPSEPGEKAVFCGETSVLAVNNGGVSGVLGASVAVTAMDVPYNDGWLDLTTSSVAPGLGLPIIGQSFVSAFNPSASAGVAGNYGLGWGHRFVRPANFK